MQYRAPARLRTQSQSGGVAWYGTNERRGLFHVKQALFECPV